MNQVRSMAVLPQALLSGWMGSPCTMPGTRQLFSDMKLIGEICHPDIALLPIGGRYTMGTDAAMMAAQFIGAKTVIPIHYNTWDRIAAGSTPLQKRPSNGLPISRSGSLNPGKAWTVLPVQ